MLAQGQRLGRPIPLFEQGAPRVQRPRAPRTVTFNAITTDLRAGFASGEHIQAHKASGGPQGFWSLNFDIDLDIEVEGAHYTCNRGATWKEKVQYK